MKNLEMARTLLDSAGRDLFVLRNAVDTPDYPDEIFGFHVQQVVEKSFKAWLALFDEPFPLSHDLTLLSDRAKAVDAEATRFDELLHYTPYAGQSRYTSSAGYKSLGRDTALRLVEELVKHVETLFEDTKENLNQA